MIKRELYMKRIRPFIGNDLIKVMTGVRRAGKSVMLELVQEELLEAGVSQSQFICINFENMQYAHLQTAQNLHSEILERAAEIKGKVYLFFDEIQEVTDWEKCINSLRVLAGGMLSLSFIRFLLRSFLNCTVKRCRMKQRLWHFRNICFWEECRIWRIFLMRKNLPDSI